MIEKYLNANLIETAINHALHLDPAATAKLASLEGSCISIQLEFAPNPWNFRIDNGQLRFTDLPAEQCDVRLTGTLSGFLRLFNNNGKKATSSEKLYIQGDLHIAQQFQRVMSELAPDFEAVLTQRFGEKLGGTMANILRQLKEQGEAARESAEKLLKQCFENENSPVLTRADFEINHHRLTALNNKLDELYNRLEKVEK